MPWKGVTIMDQRVRFISEYLEGYFPVAELCRQFNISRKTGHKWIVRYDEYGSKGLEERSSKPHSCPHKTHYSVVRVIKMARKKHPSWGPKKLLNVLQNRHPDWEYPAISTTADILKREGLIGGKKRRVRSSGIECTNWYRP